MSYSQWIGAQLSPTNFIAMVRDPSLSAGKFYCGTMDNEVPAVAVDGVVVAPGDPFTVSSCGRDQALEGTQGHFDVYDGSTEVGSFVWDCPWGKTTNTFQWLSANQNYLCQVTGGSLQGAIGSLTLVVMRM